jgi:SAM-dependent methyltransferase
MTDVAPDGSPLAVYAALPVEPDLTRVRSVLRHGATVLDLGTGVGRIANALARAGHAVVAVDNSPEMLAAVVGAEPVLGNVYTLDLGHLIDSRVRAQRLALLRVCRQHVHDDGVVLVQRYPRGWIPKESTGNIGEIGVHLHDVEMLSDGFAAKVTYSIGDRAWTQVFDAAVVDDAELAALASETGLVVRDVLDDDAAWVVLTPT